MIKHIASSLAISVMIAMSILASHDMCAQDDTSALQRDPVINVGAETYAITFRDVGGRVEAWLTVASSTSDRGVRKLARATSSMGSFTQPEIIADPALNHPDATYNGVPHFNPCDSNELVFVSDRPTTATGRRSNDIYYARRSNGVWNVERMTINSSTWDDTPVFGPRGQYIIFASDRRAPGSGRADVFISTRTPNGWSEPSPLGVLSNPATHETSPMIHGDRLYFSSNVRGDQDIWWITINPQTGDVSGEPTLYDQAGVNATGSNEYHPVISSGGGWFYVSSDRQQGSDRTYKIYRVARSRAQRQITINVTARTRIRDLQKRQFFGELDSIYGVGTSVRVRDMRSGQEVATTSGKDGALILSLTAGPLDPGVADPSTRVLTFSAEPHEAGFVGSTDTLVINLRGGCAMQLEHTVYLDDTTTRKQRCEFTFRTFNVPFFVTAYWCPTTRKYRNLTPCQTLFTDDTECERIQQPVPCETNEAYTYRFTPAKLERIQRREENCVNYKEFNDSGAVWAESVDRNIEHMRDEVRSALTDPCLQAAVGRGLPVEITYIGTTDDRTIHDHCQYTGAAYAKVRSAAPHIAIDSAIIPFIATGRHFNRGGYGGRAGGNQLLSDLRSLYFAIMFDNLCRESIPQYRELQQRGMLRVRSRGQAIDQRDLPFALKRAAGVEIRVPGYKETFAGRPNTGGRNVVMCPTGCE
ncbi:MAG: hypothetical protein RLZZ150_894 [Bacteroidota bacterium]